MRWPERGRDPDLPDGVVRFPPEPGRRAGSGRALVLLLLAAAAALLLMGGRAG